MTMSAVAAGWPHHAKVTAIVPTLAERTRREGILAAIASLRGSSVDPVAILLVVNGSRFDPETLSILQAVDDVQIVQTEIGSLPHAIHVGRGLVQTPYFCFLDDDDEYLPGAIDRRIRMLEEDPSLSLVVTNGYRRTSSTETRALRPLDNVSRDPLRALFAGNWLASCGGLFRSDQVGEPYFRAMNPYAEWTWLAYCLSLDGLRVGAIDEPTFRINDTAGSASKSDAYRMAFFGLFQRMLDRHPPTDVQTMIRRRLADHSHDVADFERLRGNRREAWRYHIASLRSGHGWRYLAYTRYLLRRPA